MRRKQKKARAQKRKKTRLPNTGTSGQRPPICRQRGKAHWQDCVQWPIQRRYIQHKTTIEWNETIGTTPNKKKTTLRDPSVVVLFRHHNQGHKQATKYLQKQECLQKHVVDPSRHTNEVYYYHTIIKRNHKRKQRKRTRTSPQESNNNPRESLLKQPSTTTTTT